MTFPDTSITIPDAATGSEHALVTANAKVYPVAMIADPSGHYAYDIYVAGSLAMAKAASKNYLSVYNADPALKVEIIRAQVVQITTAAIVGLNREYRLFRFTTAHTVGTAVTVRALNTAAPALDVDITARANGQTIAGAEAEALATGAVFEEETAGGPAQFSIFDERDMGGPIVLNTNQGVVIQQDATAGTGVLSAQIYFRVR